MDVQPVWIIAAIGTLTAGLAGYYIGRSRPRTRARQAAEAGLRQTLERQCPGTLQGADQRADARGRTNPVAR